MAADLPGVRPRVEKVAKSIQKAGLSPTGTRAVFEARGEILTVPAEKGDIRNLTETVGAVEREPVWSPDGKTIAYFSDESGEYELHILRPQNGRGEVKRFKLGDAPSFFYNPVWSPDGKRIAYADKRRNLWLIDIAGGQVDEGRHRPLRRRAELARGVVARTAKWLAYTRPLKNYRSAVFLYSVEIGQVAPDYRRHERRPLPGVRQGRQVPLLHRQHRRRPGRRVGHVDPQPPATRAAYVVVLSKDDPSPLAPESDDEKDKKDADKEKGKDEKGKDKKGSGRRRRQEPKVKVDLEDLDQRTLALPLPAEELRRAAGRQGGRDLYPVEGPAACSATDASGSGRRQRDGPPVRPGQAKGRKARRRAASRSRSPTTARRLLYRHGPEDGSWSARPNRSSPATARSRWTNSKSASIRGPNGGKFMPRCIGSSETSCMTPTFTATTWSISAWAEHERYLEGLGSRHDLNYLLDELLSGLSLQHVYLAGGDVPQAEGPTCGLLGADFRVANGRHRIVKVYRGESWNPHLRAPLTQPGAGVKEGEYLLAVNGKDIRGEEEVYKFFEGTAGKQTILRVGPSADGKGSREITVVPVDNEHALRNLAWVDANRRAVDKATGGKAAYIYLPDTEPQGYIRFNRYFFAQAGREGVIVDERFNGGGLLADHVIDYLRQPIRNYASTREGSDQMFPTSAIPGPKVMLINEQAGSGGDYLPYTFRQAGLGPLIGKRTWGGLVGIGGYPPLMDGGTVTAPRWALWFPNGRWDVENRGVAPDVDVEYDPKLVRAGKDPQLDMAIEIVLTGLAKHPVQRPARPKFPNYYKPGLKEPAEGK